MELNKRSCRDCKNAEKLDENSCTRLMQDLALSWKLVDGHHLRKELKFPDFVTALAFVNKAGELAEREGHHPDLFLTWGRVAVEVFTHSAGGLTEMDFILAAKLDLIG